MVLIDWRAISYPYLDAETPLLDAVLQRAKTSGVRTVICDGDIIYHDGKFTRVDRDARFGHCTRTCNERCPTTRSNAAASPSHCCRMCGRSTPITSTPNSMRRFIGRVPGISFILRRPCCCISCGGSNAESGRAKTVNRHPIWGKSGPGKG